MGEKEEERKFFLVCGVSPLWRNCFAEKKKDLSPFLLLLSPHDLPHVIPITTRRHAHCQETSSGAGNGTGFGTGMAEAEKPSRTSSKRQFHAAAAAAAAPPSSP